MLVLKKRNNSLSLGTVQSILFT